MTYISEEQRKRARQLAAAKGRRKAKVDALTYYSGGLPCCKICKVTDLAILCIDHINNDGAKKRKGIQRSGMSLYYALRKQGYPQGYQVLCYNCNARKENERVAILEY